MKMGEQFDSPPASQPDQGRRSLLLSWPAVMSLTALSGPAWGQAVPRGGPSPARVALLIGNRDYPEGQDLPPTHKNVRDLKAALEKRGFLVTAHVDQGPEAVKRVTATFAQQAQATPPDTVVLFYFTGHGVQVESENLMLGATVNPKAASSTLLGGSLLLKRDVIDLLPKRPTGMTVAVIDACRTSLATALAATDGLNQVEAPPGCLIVFSTGAGKPAIAPAVETRMTFYTDSLVRLMLESDDELSLSDFFRLVKLDVTEVMLKHPVQAIRNLAQVPFIAENTQIPFTLSPPKPKIDPAVIEAQRQERLRQMSEEQRKREEEERAKQEAERQRIEAAAAALFKQINDGQWPGDIRKAAQDFITEFPRERQAASARVALQGANDAQAALSIREVRLYRSAFILPSPEPLVAELRKAGRGDKDAAARVGRLYERGQGGVPADRNRYEGWMAYAAALGNGIASYELAVHYRREAQPVLAAQYEARARELSYTPPATLDNVRK
ncbi:MAG: caspase family protein [Aquabacterium sp.]